MTQTRFDLDEYSIRVLDVVKGKFGLKNRNDALKIFIKEYGGDLVEPKFDENYLIELDNMVSEHMKKYKNRKMSMKELDKLLNLEK